MTTACAYEKSCSNFFNKSILQHFYLWQKYISIKQVQYELYFASTLYDLLRRITQIKKIICQLMKDFYLDYYTGDF